MAGDLAMTCCAGDLGFRVVAPMGEIDEIWKAIEHDPLHSLLVPLILCKRLDGWAVLLNADVTAHAEIDRRHSRRICSSGSLVTLHAIQTEAGVGSMTEG